MVVDTSTLPFGVIQTYDADGILDNSTNIASLGATQVYVDADFAYQGGDGSIAGQVRHDLDNDGNMTDNGAGG